MMDERIRLLLADDHAMLRQGTAELLRREPDLEVVGEAGDGQQAVELARVLNPDIVVMDVRMPMLSGVEATRQIRESLPGVQVLVFTAHDDDQYIFGLLQAGASGYLLKTAPVSELVKAIRQIRAGESPLDPAIARKVVTQAAGEPGTALAGETVETEELTTPELEILQLVARGLSNQGIAETLQISDQTVQTYLTSLFTKMRAISRLEAVLTAIQRGWLALES